MNNITSSNHIKALGQQIERYRLLQNIAQSDLAEKAGISARTLRRLESGHGGTLDSFIRLLMALNIDTNLSALIPDSTVRPMERARSVKTERQRASRSKSSSTNTASTISATQPSTDARTDSNWVWGDEQK